jgi:uncharacterized protein YggE
MWPKVYRCMAGGVLSLLSLASLTGSASAQNSNDDPPSIRVIADATVLATPDQVEIDVGVTTQAQRSREAATRNAQLGRSVLDALKNAPGSGANLQTISYTLSPNYRYPEGGGKPTIIGYTATNMVRLTLNDLDRVGDAIDAATNAGANQIHRVQFGLRDEQAVQTQALREAVLKGRAQAEALATVLGVKIVRVLSVTESEQVIRPFDVMRLSAEASAQATPIQPGSIEMSATVTVSVEIAPR